MTDRDEQILQQLVHTREAEAWLEQLIPSFFDKESRRAVRDAVSTGLPALLPGLEAGDLARVAAGLFQELCRQASGRAAPPGREHPPPSPGVLSGPDLEDAVLEHYPYPIAAAFQALTEQESASARFGCLLDTYEALIHFLGTVAVSAYLRTDLSCAECNRFLLELLLKENWSTGDLFALMAQTVRLAGDCGSLLPYPLGAHLFRPDGRPTPSHQVLESFVALRNRRWGHGTGRTEDSFAQILGPNRRRLEEELARMPWLAGWRLVRPVQVGEDGQIHTADLLNGARRRKDRPFPLWLELADLAPAGGDVRPDRDILLLVSPDGSRYLPLFPLALLQLRSGPRGQGAYFLQRRRWQREQLPLRLTHAYYVAYEGGCPEHEEGPREFVTNSLERHAARLQGSVPGEPVPAAPDEPGNDPDCTLPEVRAEQQSHLRAFVGREQTLQAITAWIDGQTAGGYLLLLGPPGQGKSALMAELAQREAERGGCLLHMVKSHRNPLKFLPALISQAANLTGTTFGAAAYQGDVDDLRNAWVKAMEVLNERHGRAVVVLDALDELDAVGNRLAFLPPALPAGARVVLTCRPDIPLVNALRARLSGYLQEGALEPLSETDFHPFLERRLGRDRLALLERVTGLGELFHRLGGNPLFLRCFADDLAERWPQVAQGGDLPLLDSGWFPATLDALFRGIYDRVRGRGDGAPGAAEGRVRARLLQLLSVTREPLDLRQLADLLAQDGQALRLDDCRDRLEEMSQWLLDAGGGRFQPWHQALTDHVRGEVLGEEGVRQAEGIFCDWLQHRWAEAGLYGLRYRISHLLGAGRTDGACALLTDRRYLEAKAEAGLVFELAADFNRTLEALPAGQPLARLLQLLAEALQRDSRFIARHPTTLFQCLWNSCWWYDCPQARGYYDLEGRSEGSPLPWDRPGPRLSALLESWRADRERQRPGQTWLRSLRPPATHLGSVQRAVYQGHEGEVRCVSYSPDGRRLASGSLDHTVRVWDTESGAELLCLEGHQEAVHGVSFSPDSRVLASASSDTTVRLWDVATGEALLCLSGHKGAVLCVDHSPDGRQLASGASDGVVLVWDAHDGRCVRPLRGHDGWVWSVSYSPGGRRLASASADRTVRVWDPATGDEVLSLEGHGGEVWGVAYSPDGASLASCSQDTTVRLWDSTSGTRQGRFSLPNEVASVAYSADGARLIAGGLGRLGVAWNIRPDAEGERNTVFLSGHGGAVTAVSPSPAGERVATASADQTVRIWDLGGGRESLPLRSFGTEVTCVACSPDGQLVADGTVLGDLEVWDAGTGEPVRLVQSQGVARLEGLCFSQDGRWVAGASAAGLVNVWDVGTGELAHLLHHRKGVRHTRSGRMRKEGGPLCVCFSPDGLHLASGSVDRLVRIWDLQKPVCLHRLRGHKGAVLCVVYSDDGRRLASGSADRTVRVWDAEGEREPLCLRGHGDGVLAVQFSADGRRLLSRSADGTGRLWDLRDGTCLRTLPAMWAGEDLPGALPWQARQVGEETVVEPREGGQAVAWFPLALGHLTGVPSRRFEPQTSEAVRRDGIRDPIWVGASAAYLSLFTLES